MSDEELRGLERAAEEAAPAVMRYFRALERAGKLPSAPYRVSENDAYAVLDRLRHILTPPDVIFLSGRVTAEDGLDPDVRRLRDSLRDLLRGPTGPPGMMGLSSAAALGRDEVREIVRDEIARAGALTGDEIVRRYRANARELASPFRPEPPPQDEPPFESTFGRGPYAAPEDRAPRSHVRSGAPEPPTDGMFGPPPRYPDVCPVCNASPACTQDCR